MVDAGILSEDEPVELLHGMLVEKAVKSPAHETVKNRLMRWLVLASPAGRHDVRIDVPGCPTARRCLSPTSRWSGRAATRGVTRRRRS